MTPEQETAMAQDEGPKHRWNSSTKLRQTSATKARNRRNSIEVAVRSRQQEQKGGSDQAKKLRLTNNGKHSEDYATEDKQEQQTLTRKLLERAVSTAFDGLLKDSTLDDSAFSEFHKSRLSELSSVNDKENMFSSDISTTKVEAKLHSTLEEIEALTTTHCRRRREHVEVLHQASEDTRSVREFHRRMKHAAFEHRERKLAVQALQARIQREIQFLTATAADLEKREFLLDDAFESYKLAVRLELGLCPSNPQGKAD